MKLQKTVFDSPVANFIFKIIAKISLFIFRWRTEGELPDEPKYVLIAAPHTSNWDFFFTLVVAFELNAKIYWMGKDALFKKPYTGIMKWLGGVPIVRSSSHNVVDQTVEQFKQNDKLVITVPPSGTRSQVSYWKTGFYHIALGAGVPIALGFLDYGRRTGGIGPTIVPSGDYVKDMEIIASFYSGIMGKYPERVSNMKIKAPDEKAA